MLAASPRKMTQNDLLYYTTMLESYNVLLWFVLSLNPQLIGKILYLGD